MDELDRCLFRYFATTLNRDKRLFVFRSLEADRFGCIGSLVSRASRDLARDKTQAYTSSTHQCELSIRLTGGYNLIGTQNDWVSLCCQHFIPDNTNAMTCETA